MMHSSNIRWLLFIIGIYQCTIRVDAENNSKDKNKLVFRNAAPTASVIEAVNDTG